MFRFEGIYTPIVTPMHPDGAINYDVFGQQLDFLVASGVHGIIVGGTTGEYYAMSMTERVETISFAAKHLNGNVPLIAGVGTIRTEESIELALHARKQGAAGLLIGSPPYAVPTELENAMHALAIADKAELPIMLYNYPGRTGATMGETFLRTVTQRDLFCAIKESSGDINAMHRIAMEYPSLQLSCGADDQALEFFAWGARSWVCGGANFLPKEHIALYEACVLRGDYKTGRAMMRVLLPLMRMLEQGGQFVQSIKHGCEWAGLNAGPVRRPLQQLDDDAKPGQITLFNSIRSDMAALIQAVAQERAQNIPPKPTGYA
jgi:4-hydroxy-tetrahydrodipicolinate synthase